MWLQWLILWYWKISSLPKFYYRLSNRRGVPVKKCRALEHAGKVVIKSKLDVIYWERCQDLGLCPNFLKFRPPKLKQYRNVENIYQQVVVEAWKSSKNDMEKKEAKFNKLKQEVLADIGFLDKITLLSLLNQYYRKYTEQVQLTHNAKLLSLWMKQRPKCPDCIKNLSSRQLTLEEQHVLYRGLKHHVIPKNVPVQQLKANIEKCVNSAIINVAHQQTEDNTSASQFNDEINKVAKNLCTLEFRDEIKSGLKIFVSSAKAICNTRFTQSFHNNINKLANDENVKICSFDKGVGLVILDSNQYYDKLDCIVNDTTKFSKIEYQDGSKHPITTDEKSIQSYLYRYFKKSLDSKLYSKVYPSGSNPGKLYGMCKVHKIDNPMRPVVSMIGTSQYELAKLLDSWIKPFIPKTYALDSTADFLTKLRGYAPNDNDYCVSFDVVSLFTNIPLEETIKIIADFIYADKSRILYPIKKDIFIKLLRKATQGTFLYRDQLYKQVDGVSMGNCLAPTLANFFLGHLEEKLFERCIKEFYPNFYRRYVDDIFCVFSNQSDADRFFGSTEWTSSKFKVHSRSWNKKITFFRCTC